MPESFGRVPPHDLDAEAAVLSALLLESAARDVALEVLEPAHFYSDANRLIFEAAREAAFDAYRDGSVAVDITTVAAKLRSQQKIQAAGGARYLSQIVDATPAVAHIEAHCAIVREKHRLRGAIALGHAMAAEGYGDVGDPQEWLDGKEQALYEITRSKVRSPTVHISQALTETFTAMQEAAERGEAISGTPTGFADLDKLIGGLHKSDLLIVAARPGMGKSAALLNMAASIASPLPDGQGGIAKPGAGVALFSLEMPKEQVSARMAFSGARVNLYGLRVPSVLSQADWGALTSASSYLARLPIWVDDTPAINLLELRARVRRVQSEAARRDCWACMGSGQEPYSRECPACGGTGVYPIELGMVGVDYLQLMKHVGEKGQSREQEVSALSRGLKALAKELDVPVVALSQLNRKVEERGSKDKRPVLADLRECLAYDEWVYTPSGPVQIGSKPSEVCCHNGSFNSIAQYIPKKHNTVYAVRTQFGTVRATARHPILTGTGYKQVRHLVPGRDVVAAPRQIMHDNRGPVPHGRLLGWLIGNGSCAGTPGLIYRRELHDQVVAEVRQFGVEVRPRKAQKSANVIDAYLSNGTESGCLPNPLMRWIRELKLEGKTAHTKGIPKSYLGSSGETHRQLLRGLWEADGTVTRGIAKYSTCNERLARQVMWLLLTVGVRSTISIEQDGLCQVAASTVDAQAMAHIVSGLPSDDARFGKLKLPRENRIDPAPAIFVELAAEIGGARRFQRRRDGSYKAICKRDLMKIVRDARGALDSIANSPYGYLRGVGWGRVWSIDKLEGEPRVADLHVPGFNNFVSNGLLVHNSGAIEQDADTIVFIYRDDYYNAESDERGIAELIVGKQRNGPTGVVKMRWTAACTRFDNLAPGYYEEE